MHSKSRKKFSARGIAQFTLLFLFTILNTYSQEVNDYSKDPYNRTVISTDQDLNSLRKGTESILYNSTKTPKETQIYPSPQQQNNNPWFKWLLNNSDNDSSENLFHFNNPFPNNVSNTFYKLSNSSKEIPDNTNLTTLDIILPTNTSSNIFNKFTSLKPLIPTKNNNIYITSNVPDMDSISLDSSNRSNTLDFRNPLSQFLNSPANSQPQGHNSLNSFSQRTITPANESITNFLAKTIGQDKMKNVTSMVTDMLSKLGLQKVYLGNPTSPLNLFKLNVTDGIVQEQNETYNTGETDNKPGSIFHTVPVSENVTSVDDNRENQTSFISSLSDWISNFTNSIFSSSSNNSNNQINSTSSTKLPINTLPAVPSIINQTSPSTTNATTSQNISFAFEATDSYSNAYGKIIYSSIYHSHGSYTPPEPYPTDPYKSLNIWPDGVNALTNKGKNEMNQLGTWLRQRYQGLIGTHYNQSLVTIYSGDSDTTIMSAECLASGLFPPKGHQMWNQFINWQPVTIHTIPPEKDNIILMTQFCQQYSSRAQLLNGSPNWVQFYNNNYDTIRFIGENSGYNFTKESILNDFQRIYQYYEDLRIEKEHGLPLPNWTTTVYPEPMRSIASKYLQLAVEDVQMKKTKTGPFLKAIIKNMKNKTTNSSDPETLQIYSGDMEGLAFIMEALEISNSLIPPTSSALLFDLRLRNQEYIVTILYKNSSNDPYFLTIPKCQPICTLNAFINITKDFISENWNDECSTLTLSDLTYTIPVIIFGVVIIVIMILVIILIVRKCYKCCTKNRGKMRYN